MVVLVVVSAVVVLTLLSSSALVSLLGRGEDVDGGDVGEASGEDGLLVASLSQRRERWGWVGEELQLPALVAAAAAR